jgi:hypothetical protein
MKKNIIILLGILFSIPDARLFGFTGQSFLLSFCLLLNLKSISRFQIKFFINKNIPFLFLFFYSLLIFLYLILFDSLSKDSEYFIFSKIKELFSMLLFSYTFFSIIFNSENKDNLVKVFLEAYFFSNLFYLLLVTIKPDIAPVFHDSLMPLPAGVVENRVYLLGFEPSYTVPVTMIFYLLYILVSNNKWLKILFFFITLYVFIGGQSATGYILLFIWVYYYYLSDFRKWNFKKKAIGVVISLTVLFSLFNVYKNLDAEYGISKISSLSISEQSKIISYITRTELINFSISTFFHYPLGLGIGNSVVVMGTNISERSSEFNSLEILDSSLNALTPKSQFMEYLISAGIVFLIMFYKYFIDFFKSIRLSDVSNKKAFNAIVIISLVLIIIGERIPYIFIGTLIYVILQSSEDSNTLNHENIPVVL